MDVSIFDFTVPEHLIAQTPLADRAQSRLLVVHKATGRLEHRRFYDIGEFLRPGDCLVMNNSKVIPARLWGMKESTGAKVEVLLLHRRDGDLWETLVRPGKKVREGDVLVFGDGLLKGVVEGRTEAGGRVVRFEYDGTFEAVLDRLGEMPLPPYIRTPLTDAGRYQTVYAKEPGSAAAPTAGLHFTEALLAQLEERGVQLAFVTLHVGLGTFRPVTAERVEDHQMHAEYYEVDEETAQRIRRTKEAGGRIIAVGTTSCRTLEAIAQKFNGQIEADRGWTDLFIYPGFRFQVIDGLVTNFHLPRSTLVMLVSAFAGLDLTRRAYEAAIRENYRFYSFGDAMLIVD
ncbi:MAG: tRNA preQ1(34) S-adenosylmethionine ribosyltransferase-isomerase QueA [Bacillaceae bacterium G1]|nr:tRNA preQ1(34) S-adenosylmethionine ribosyltransferase-isomerase QueA [Bacillota bacterium]OJF18332.1 MAG: tRNA preQ1(34) S-adenosylmethionine ribosyltransferase-isomerase QueA [Bacillaceae bacterium G1]